MGTLELKKIKKSFKKKEILHGIDLQIKSSEVYGLLGPNGAGKTTLFSLISGLVMTTSGKILFDENDITFKDISFRASKGIIYLPQEPKFVDGTMLNNLLGQNRIKKEQMTEILRSVDLLDFINSDPKGINMQMTNRGEDLPFGIRKRIALARALVIGGQLVVLDEPTESIDDRGRTSIYKLITELLRNNKTVIISTQDEQITQLANCIVNLDVKPSPQITRGK